jgi:hypothetical protein
MLYAGVHQGSPGHLKETQVRQLGLPLKLFCLKDDINDRGDPFFWPAFDLCPYLASPNVSAMSYLVAKHKFNSWTIWDMSHGSWDDEKLTLSDLDQKGWLLLMLVAFNVLDGPYKSDQRYQEAVSAMRRAWRNSCLANHPRFMELSVAIIEEIGLDITAADACDQAWMHMINHGPLSAKGRSCSLNRFHGFTDETTMQIASWWQRHFVYMFTCLESDYIHGLCEAEEDAIGSTARRNR